MPVELLHTTSLDQVPLDGYLPVPARTAARGRPGDRLRCRVRSWPWPWSFLRAAAWPPAGRSRTQDPPHSRRRARISESPVKPSNSSASGSHTASQITRT